MTALSKDQILACLQELSAEMGKRSLKGEILLFGGAAMVLAFNARISTKDVDAVFRPKSEMYEIAAEIADRHDLPKDWLNDSVKGFIHSDPLRQDLLVRFDFLSVYVPEPEYLLAMKCMSMRIGVESSDIDDVKTLLTHLGIKTPAEVFSLIEGYYPHHQIPQRTFYAIDEILQGIFG